ncbi:Hpt domain-containing protein [Afipia sp. P52-10]|uniref:Hpt domain-containing protein n=1 Tax=Afipia sp. P52-10 TaxID=1429916 RepID=UPI001FCA8F8C|nr:Hpt domain-containing protein [Afipia sp. P52-10]
MADNQAKAGKNYGNLAASIVNWCNVTLTKAMVVLPLAGRGLLRLRRRSFSQEHPSMSGPVKPEAKSPGWVASPSLVPEGPAIDFNHLERMTLGERGIEQEVLALFRTQLVDLLGRLEKLPREGMSLAHTLKGSARGVGAFAVGDAADQLERNLRAGVTVDADVATLRERVSDALQAIDERLRAR